MGQINCLHPGCQRPSRTRRLCYQHYDELAKEVKAGLTSWAELAMRGLCSDVDRRESRRRFNHPIASLAREEH
jgi:hypothetical protein